MGEIASELEAGERTSRDTERAPAPDCADWEVGVADPNGIPRSRRTTVRPGRAAEEVENDDDPTEPFARLPEATWD